jgi:hypothetical protein
MIIVQGLSDRFKLLCRRIRKSVYIPALGVDENQHVNIQHRVSQPAALKSPFTRSDSQWTLLFLTVDP